MSNETKAQHTPGPWHVTGYGYRRNDAAPTGRECYICTADSGLAEGYLIAAANVTVCEIKTHRRIEDARLIASAPSMFEVCQAIAALADGQGRMNMLEVAGWARQVLASVTA